MLNLINLFSAIIILINLINLSNCNISINKKYNNNLIDESIDYGNSILWGPGLLESNIITLPVRYFYIKLINNNNELINNINLDKLKIVINGDTINGKCRYLIEKIKRNDNIIITRYKLTNTCFNVNILIKYNNKNVGDSPYSIEGNLYSENCYCPEKNIGVWLENLQCTETDKQIQQDLIPFKTINYTHVRDKIINKFDQPGSISICNYAVKKNTIYRKCYGQYTGFKMFIDSILLSLVRKVIVPDLEFFINLGDWPLVKKGGVSRTTGPLPMLSWCGSDDTYDIVIPTYDLTESTIESMGRISLDIFAVQRDKKHWHEKIPQGFWRGRDSRQERLDLIDLSRKNPELLNASLTNFFFYRDKEADYGPKVPHISFLDFFDYKYQINIDGTVAAYRLPYLLAGNSLVLKQESNYYEHFYKKLLPYEHYIPIKSNLNDLIDKIKWALNNDNKMLNITKTTRRFINEHLMPINIYCYYGQLFNELSKRIVSEIKIDKTMEIINETQHNKNCNCNKNYADDDDDDLAKETLIKDEL